METNLVYLFINLDNSLYPYGAGHVWVYIHTQIVYTLCISLEISVHSIWQP